MMRTAIEAQRLAKVYRNGRGLLGIDLAVAEGEIFGFLGPNGAGKTTTIRSLLGLLHVTGGSARVLGLDVVRDSVAVRARTGYLPGEPALYDGMTGRQHLELALGLRGNRDRQRAQRLEQRLEVELDRRVRQLSKGNRQKVAILLALAHDAPVLILDEPTSGLDPLMQEIFLDLLREERSRGKTVFFSSHVLPEVEAVADRVAIIREGRLVAVDTVERLRGNRLKQVSLRFAGPAPDLKDLPGVHNLQVADGRIRCHLSGDLTPLFRLLAEHPGADVSITDPSLEAVFRTYYGGQVS